MFEKTKIKTKKRPGIAPLKNHKYLHITIGDIYTCSEEVLHTFFTYLGSTYLHMVINFFSENSNKSQKSFYPTFDLKFKKSSPPQFWNGRNSQNCHKKLNKNVLPEWKRNKAVNFSSTIEWTAWPLSHNW